MGSPVQIKLKPVNDPNPKSLTVLNMDIEGAENISKDQLRRDADDVVKKALGGRYEVVDIDHGGTGDGKIGKEENVMHRASDKAPEAKPKTASSKPEVVKAEGNIVSVKVSKNDKDPKSSAGLAAVNHLKAKQVGGKTVFSGEYSIAGQEAAGDFVIYKVRVK